LQTRSHRRQDWTNCSVSNISMTTENSLDLSPILFTPQTRQDKTVLSCPCRWCEQYIIIDIPAQCNRQASLQAAVGYQIVLPIDHLNPPYHPVCPHKDGCSCKSWPLSAMSCHGLRYPHPGVYSPAYTSLWTHIIHARWRHLMQISSLSSSDLVQAARTT